MKEVKITLGRFSAEALKHIAAQREKTEEQYIRSLFCPTVHCTKNGKHRKPLKKGKTPNVRS